ncbi:hypothetical protein A2I98_19235 [Pseudoalteromonas agarivorans]|uniref:Uncharacterized protein n=1 Tax=Pseudoalteromonas agarivorans TaxID=176102 RepID=A0ABR5VP69_9GAMM|nr:hypothetical protein [Pseudoalteromonas telluritireducens]KYL31556.1 hypothetical protein A2I98_19235 [Pseudoalteromonas telluritireducens]
MKSLILASLFASASALIVLPAYAQTDTDAVVQTEGMANLVNVLNNATAETAPEQLKADLVTAINGVCTDCTPAQVDSMMTVVVDAIGAESPLIADFLAALVAAGVDSDAVTLAAITAGVDATIASEATAAGPTEPTAPAGPVIVTLPTTTVPQGAGGTGGDAGISEVGN